MEPQHLTSGCSGRSFLPCPAQRNEFFLFSFLRDLCCKNHGKRLLFIIEGHNSCEDRQRDVWLRCWMEWRGVDGLRSPLRERKRNLLFVLLLMDYYINRRNCQIMSLRREAKPPTTGDGAWKLRKYGSVTIRSKNF